MSFLRYLLGLKAMQLGDGLFVSYCSSSPNSYSKRCGHPSPDGGAQYFPNQFASVPQCLPQSPLCQMQFKVEEKDRHLTDQSAARLLDPGAPLTAGQGALVGSNGAWLPGGLTWISREMMSLSVLFILSK